MSGTIEDIGKKRKRSRTSSSNSAFSVFEDFLTHIRGGNGEELNLFEGIAIPETFV